MSGYVSEFMSGGRVVSHGKIMDLSEGFSLPEGVPFTIYVRPKFAQSQLDIVLSVRTVQGNGFAEAPFLLNDWSPLAITEIASAASLMEQFDIYWGSGSYSRA